MRGRSVSKKEKVTAGAIDDGLPIGGTFKSGLTCSNIKMKMVNRLRNHGGRQNMLSIHNGPLRLAVERTLPCKCTEDNKVW
jgi:hypothetical protein